MCASTPAVRGVPPYDFEFEQFCRENESQLRKLDVPIVRLDKETPGTHKSSLFRITSQFQARVTPSNTLFLLDFVDNNGSRIEGRGRTGFVIYARGAFVPSRAVEMESQASACDIYYLSPTRPDVAYEICHRETQQVIKTITFPPTVQCV